MKGILTLLLSMVLACSVVTLPVSAKNNDEQRYSSNMSHTKNQNKQHHSSFKSINKRQKIVQKHKIKKATRTVYIKNGKPRKTVIKVVERKPDPIVSLLLLSNHLNYTYFH